MPTNNCERSGDGPAGTVSAASFRRGEGLHIPGPAAPVFHCAVIAAFTLHLAKPRSRSRSIAISARRTTTGPVETHQGRRRRHRNTQGDRHKEAGVPGGVKRRERQQAVLAPSQPLPARTYRWRPAAIAPRSLPVSLTGHFARGAIALLSVPTPLPVLSRLSCPLAGQELWVPWSGGVVALYRKIALIKFQQPELTAGCGSLL